MFKCPSCAVALHEESHACPSCGASLEEAFAPTRILGEAPSKTPSGGDARLRRSESQPLSSIHATYDSIDKARFISGTVLAERYRIVGLLGRGGMGEVYRAEDLRLSQVVALKFLPERLSTNGAALARFHREVRIARQISHRNVCRVYDIGEAEGLQFLSMEYVRGEELSSVIKRFGRLPVDKAIDISRQICAGLASAHDAGVLHRDLKPSNVMIDENGNVRILDFGLAGLTEDFQGDVALEGTPEYMSPEQFTGRELSPRSDIYSLGLVLYEIFTGRKAFSANSLNDLIRLRKTDSLPEMPSSIVKDVDPLVERVIERCVAPDPRDRPSSALEVAAAMPGGDPLAAALAAGETPSPEMVAAASKQGSLRPPIALAMVVGIALLLTVDVFLARRLLLHNLVPLEKSTQGLRERAEDIALKFGYRDGVDEAYSFEPDIEYLKYVAARDTSPNRWDRLATGQPSAIRFWYRQSPRFLLPYNRLQVTAQDPPPSIADMTGIQLDTDGRLLSFYGVPRQLVEADSANVVANFDWSHAFAEAGLNMSAFRQVSSSWNPPHAYDSRIAWEGTYPGHADVPLRVEAASFQGRPVYFDVISPWTRPTRQEQFQERAGVKAAEMIVITVFVVIMLGAALLARHNLRLGRGDRRGATRLALFVFGVAVVGTLLASHHVSSINGELALFVETVAQSLFIAGLLWLVYVALEPFLRRRWPARIIAWNRLLAGDYRDPLVGRDLLVGAMVGFGLMLIGFLQMLTPRWLGLAATPPIPIFMKGLLGFEYLIANVFDQVLNSMIVPAILMFVLLLIAIITRREWISIAAVWILLTGISVLASENPMLELVFGGVNSALLLFCLLRFGMLAIVFTQFFALMFTFFPITSDFSTWYASGTIFPLAIAAGLILYGLQISLAGQKLFTRSLVED